MANVHTPQRLEGESQEQYRERQAQSKSITRGLRRIGLGNQRTAPSARQQLRDNQRRNGTLRGVYGQGLMNAWDRKREREQALNRRSPIDNHGTYTLTGRPRGYGVLDTSELPNCGRRIWLAGISAQRGF